MVFSIPYLGMIGIITIGIPIKIERIPLIKEIKENWYLNFMPSWYPNLI